MGEVMDLAQQVARRFAREGRVQGRHYRYTDRKLQNLNDPDVQAESASEFGGYEQWRIEIVPVKDIKVPKVWNPRRFENAKKLLSSGKPIDPIRAFKHGSKWEIDDGIHRTNASITLGYTHVPVLTSEWVATPERLRDEPAEKPQLPVGAWVKLTEPEKWGGEYGIVMEQIGSNKPRGVRRWRYGLGLVEPGATWAQPIDMNDLEFEPVRRPPWGAAVEEALRRD